MPIVQEASTVNTTLGTDAISITTASIPALPGDVLLVTVSTRVITFNVDITSVTVNGTDITPNLINKQIGGVLMTAVYYYIIPAIENYSATVTSTTEQEFVVGLTAFSGVDTSRMPTFFESATSSDLSPTDTVTTGNVPNNPDLIVDVITTGNRRVITPTLPPPIPIQIYQAQESPIGGITGAAFRRNFDGVDTYSLNSFDLYTTVSVGLFALAVICVAHDTQILLADGTTKAIHNIKRGDRIAGDLNRNTANKVARVIYNRMPGITPVSLVKITKDAIGVNQPTTDLILTSGHPILYNDKLYRAKSFRKLPGVTYCSSHKTTASDILPINKKKNKYVLYNIQYEHDGFYVANGLIVNSVPPLSSIMPLPKNLYFNKKLYNVKQESIVPALTKETIMPQ